MGKIRVKTLGEDGSEEEQKKRDAIRRAKKRAQKEGDKVKTPGKSKGGERVVAVGPSEAELEAATKSSDKEVQSKREEKSTKTGDKRKEESSIRRAPRVRSKRYKESLAKVDRNKFYEPKEAIELAMSTGKAGFSGSVEAHFNLTKKARELKLKNDKELSLSFEKKFPLAHAKLGSMKDKPLELEKNLTAIVKFIAKKNITKVTVSSTMGPGVKVQI